MVKANALPRGADSAELAEAELVAAARRGDAAAREALTRRYLPDVYRLTLRILGERGIAEDATQEAFVSMLRALPGFRGDASFRTWLLKIAANAAYSAGRRQSRRHEVPITGAALHASGERDAASRVEQQAELARVEQALGALPTKQRLAVALRAQQGLSFAEVGAAIGCSEGAARVNYHLGVKRLRELLT
ncbi:MAG TPA: sigma-70 family RNA polymerase sigma factor [Longimicrobiales bacterium]|nr:sigma-70 family RNA polymerase sigma factor [Longimicrobiales bacterium]